MSDMIVLVSACLAGVNCKYDGGNNERKRVVKILKKGGAILVCPEQLGGLTTPRPAADLYSGDGHDVLDGNAVVKTKENKDISSLFIRGAQETLRIAQIVSPDVVLLKQRSPSCGCGLIYNPEGRIIKGDGVTTALLKQNGFVVESID